MSMVLGGDAGGMDGCDMWMQSNSLTRGGVLPGGEAGGKTGHHTVVSLAVQNDQYPPVSKHTGPQADPR
jgi:hypothetical protein